MKDREYGLYWLKTFHYGWRACLWLPWHNKWMYLTQPLQFCCCSADDKDEVKPIEKP